MDGKDFIHFYVTCSSGFSAGLMWMCSDFSTQLLEGKSIRGLEVLKAPTRLAREKKNTQLHTNKIVGKVLMIMKAQRLKERERELSIHLFSVCLALCDIVYGLFRRKSGCSVSPFIKNRPVKAIRGVRMDGRDGREDASSIEKKGDDRLLSSS